MPLVAPLVSDLTSVSRVGVENVTKYMGVIQLFR